MTLISIIIPCYNYGWLLAETLDSVIAQSYTNWECIVVDDGSTDNTRDTVVYYEKQDRRIKYVYKTNGGLSSARNEGLRLAKGEYIQLLDADDLIGKRKLELQLAVFKSNTILDIIYSDVRYFLHGELSLLSKSFDMNDTAWAEELFGSGDDILKALLKHNQFVVNAPLFKASLLSKIAGFDEDLRSMEDWHFWLLCALHGAHFYFFQDSNSFAYVRIHESSMSQNKTRMLEYAIKVRQSISELLKFRNDNTLYKLNLEYIVSTLNELAIIDFKKRKYIPGIKFFFQAAKMTGAYFFYFKSTIYWFKQNLTNGSHIS